MANGTVKFYNEKAGYGFITPEDGSKDVFFHKSKMLVPVKDGDTVEFTLAQGKKGPEATDVKKV